MHVSYNTFLSLYSRSLCGMSRGYSRDIQFEFEKKSHFYSEACSRPKTHTCPMESGKDPMVANRRWTLSGLSTVSQNATSSD